MDVACAPTSHKMSLHDLTSGSCAGSSTGAGPSALSALSQQVTGGRRGLREGLDDGAMSEEYNLVHAPLGGNLNSGEQELVDEFLTRHPHARSSLHMRPPPPLPTFFPRELGVPYARVPEPDAHAATAMFERQFADSVHAAREMKAPRVANHDVALWQAACNRTKERFPHADDNFVHAQVHEFMRDVHMHSHNPPHLHMPPPYHPPPYVVGAPHPTWQDSFARMRISEHARNVSQSIARRSDPVLDASEFKAFSDSLASKTDEQIKEQIKDTNDKNTLSEEEARALNSLTNSQSWGDEFTSLENLESDAREPTVLETSAVTDEPREALSDPVLDNFEQAFSDTYTVDLAAYLGRDPAESAYEFAQVNQFSGLSAAEALAEGQRLRSEGQLAKALDAFESAVNRPSDDPHPALSSEESSQAWYLLGTTHAECDDDVRAIQALSRVLSMYPKDGMVKKRPYLAPSLLSLSVCYTNEVDSKHALSNMRLWLDARVDVWGDPMDIPPDMANAADVANSDAETPSSLLRRLQSAARVHPEDVDVQIATGVVHSLMREFNAAASAFRCAVSMRTNDARLWNKLGATLANGGETDDALRAYRRAVDISPSFIRAWVNVGTAYGNRSEWDKAARYYLRALAMCTEAREQQTSRRSVHDDMRHVWEYLRGALFSMDREDLAEYVDRADLDALRQHFTF